MSKSFAKVLTKNDSGESGAHQGGICVPKKNSKLVQFFPPLDPSEENPSTWIHCTTESGEVIKMRYVYYNNKIHKKGTRNEYRITYMTKFFKAYNAKSGDSVVFSKLDEEGCYKIEIQKATSPKPGVIMLRGWNEIH